MSNSVLNYNTKTQPKTITVYEQTQEPKSVTLELSLPEAILLRTIGGIVGGCPRDSARKYMDSIVAKFDELELPWMHSSEVFTTPAALQAKSNSTTNIEIEAAKFVERNTSKRTVDG